MAQGLSQHNGSKTPRVIVSFTSYPKRISSVASCAVTLLRQTLQADEVMLWLSRSDFPNGAEDLPESLVDLESRGLKICWTDESYGCHDKYYWAMKRFSQDIIITADDDVLYPPTFIQGLIETHYAHSESVVAYRTHRIFKSSQSELAPYSDWGFEQTDYLDSPRVDLLPTGVGGVLYPPFWATDDLYNMDVIGGCLSRADDLWLYIHGRMIGSTVVSIGSGAFPLVYIDGTQEHGLYLDNLENGGNDEALKLFFSNNESLLDAILDSIDLISPDASVPDEGAHFSKSWFSAFVSWARGERRPH